MSSLSQRAWWRVAWFVLVAWPIALSARADEPLAPTVLDAANASAGSESSMPSEDDGASPEYLALVAQALSEYGARHFEEARALFLKAHEMLPNARTLRGLGMTEFERRDYLPCIAYLEEALAAGVKPLTGELREDTEHLLARARTFVGAVQLDVTPTSARLSIDGEPVHLSAKPLMLQVGEHMLEARAEQYIAQRQTLSVHGGETLRIALRLERTQGASAEISHDRKWWKSPWLWIGTGAMIVAAATVFGVLASREERDPEPKIRQGPPEKTDHTVATFQALGASTP